MEDTQRHSQLNYQMIKRIRRIIRSLAASVKFGSIA